MIKKVLLSLSLVSLIAAKSNAQATSPCGTTEMNKIQLLLHPEIAAKEAALSKEIADKLSKLSKKELSPFAKVTSDGNVMYDVPLVFHIIHDYGAEYLPDADIVASVKDINDIYLKRNADTAGIIAPYKGFINNSNTRYIGKANITWHLATIDPSGKPTNGVTRRRNYITKNANDLAKYDQWPPSSYMNIWVINAFKPSADGFKPAAYAYKPATGDGIPYYDGVITIYSYVNYGVNGALPHELGHELNLSHTWGDTNSPEIACGDDEVDDTPYTRGHASCTSSALYDDSCAIVYNRLVGKLRLDTFKRADSPTYTKVVFADTSTSKGISFQCRTASRIDSISFYPSAPIGSTYKIGLMRGTVLMDSITVVTTVANDIQRVSPKFNLPRTDSATLFKLFFMKNPGAYRDTVTPSVSVYAHGIGGTVLLKSTNSDSFYNFFYDWRTTYGYYKIYPTASGVGDSLVDYPDTSNTQNVMEYSYCGNKMFTAGQVDRMRAAITSSVAHRDSLISSYNLAKTGVFLTPSLAPKAEFSIELARTPSGISATSITPSYFLCADNAALAYNFVFKNRTWQAPATSIAWTLSNAAVIPTSSSATTVETKFANSGWATINMVATNANGSSSFKDSVYVADPTAINPIGYWQDFNSKADNDKWPIFNYYNNRYKWEVVSVAGTYDATSMRYRSYDDRTFPESLVGDASGDYDDFFTPAFDLSNLGTNGNLNFMYAGAYATNNVDLMKDKLEISYSTNCGANWTLLDSSLRNNKLQTVGTVAPPIEYIPNWADWKPISIDLKSGTTKIRDTRVFFRFRYKPSSRPVVGSQMFASGNNFYIDRINISDNPLSVNEMIMGDKKATVAPNPTNSNAFVLFQKPNAHVTIQVMDITGKLVYSVTEKVDQNNARVEIPASYLGAKGVYLVHITGDDNLNQTEKLIVY